VVVAAAVAAAVVAPEVVVVVTAMDTVVAATVVAVAVAGKCPRYLVPFLGGSYVCNAITNGFFRPFLNFAATAVAADTAVAAVMVEEDTIAAVEGEFTLIQKEIVMRVCVGPCWSFGGSHVEWFRCPLGLSRSCRYDDRGYGGGYDRGYDRGG
jgi:hypothetical protein